MQTATAHSQDVNRVLHRLGVTPLDVLASMRDDVVVLDGEGRAVAVLGSWPDELPRGAGDLLGKSLREIFGGRQAASVHEVAELRAFQGEHVTYEWSRRRGRESIRVSTTASPLRDARSKIVGVVLITRTSSSQPPGFHAGSPLNPLSSRERQVLELLGRGYRPRSIAEQLRVSPETVRNHLKAMFRKTGTHSQEELTALHRAAGGM